MSEHDKKPHEMAMDFINCKRKYLDDTDVAAIEYESFTAGYRARDKQMSKHDNGAKRLDEMAEREVMRVNDCTQDEVGEYATDINLFKAGYRARDEQVRGLAQAIENYCRANNVSANQPEGSCYDQFNKALAAFRAQGEK